MSIHSADVCNTYSQQSVIYWIEKIHKISSTKGIRNGKNNLIKPVTEHESTKTHKDQEEKWKDGQVNLSGR